MFNKNAKMLFIALVLALITTLLLVMTTSADPDVAGFLWLDPANPSTAVGTTVDVDVRLDSVIDVYGAEMAMTFDPAVLEVVDAEITPGVCPQPDFVAVNSADNVLGTINYAATQLAPTPPCDGGVVATITFECKVSDVTSPVNFDSGIISDLDGLPIDHTTQGAVVECTGGFNVVGTVGLQSWPDPSGVTVVLKDSAGSIADSTIVGPTGAFNLSAPDLLETYSVEASYDRYLSVEVIGLTGNAGDTIDLGLATLRAGDINGDGIINILDLSGLAGNFNKTSPQPW